jgi:SAM-dependent methyltransferase
VQRVGSAGQNPPVSDLAAVWDAAYLERGAEGVSWYQASPVVSLDIIAALGVPADAAVIDVGGGASTLADELLARGYTDVTVLDLSEVALRAGRERLGTAVTWLHEDVLAWRPERAYALWHDRAVFHFFTDEPARQAYLHAMDAGVAPGGRIVLGTFAPDAPPRCSGLPVERYSAASLTELLGPAYAARIEVREVHVTPRGVRQPFTWVGLERTDGRASGPAVPRSPE